jgi:hypothetical protein
VFSEINNDLVNYQNEGLVKTGVILNLLEVLMRHPLIIVNQADAIVRNHLHNATSLLLEGQNRGLLIVEIFLLNSSHCSLNIVKVYIEALFQITVD